MKKIGRIAIQLDVIQRSMEKYELNKNYCERVKNITDGKGNDP